MLSTAFDCLRIAVMASSLTVIGTLAGGCAAQTEDERREDVNVAIDDDTTSTRSQPVCDYAGGQSLVVGRVVAPPRVSGCCTVHIMGPVGYFECPTTKTQYLGCQDGAGNLSSWGPYAISSTGNYTSLPAGASTCGDPP